MTHCELCGAEVIGADLDELCADCEEEMDSDNDRYGDKD